MDPAGPVELTVDVGSQRKLASVEIAWEFPAKAFAVSISTDGVKWSEVHATDSNVLSSSRMLGSARASKIKLVMHQVRMPMHALHNGAALLRSVRQLATFVGTQCMGFGEYLFWRLG